MIKTKGRKKKVLKEKITHKDNIGQSILIVITY